MVLQPLGLLLPLRSSIAAFDSFVPGRKADYNALTTINELFVGIVAQQHDLRSLFQLKHRRCKAVAPERVLLRVAHVIGSVVQGSQLNKSPLELLQFFGIFRVYVCIFAI